MREHTTPSVYDRKGDVELGSASSLSYPMVHHLAVRPRGETPRYQVAEVLENELPKAMVRHPGIELPTLLLAKQKYTHPPPDPGPLISVDGAAAG